MVAGEASADAHAAGVLRALRQRRPDLEAFGLGGPALRAAGLRGHEDAGALEIVGFSAVASRLPRLVALQRRLARDLRERRPHVLVCIDLPDFNALLARRARALGIPVLFYVGPQAWAWRPGRARRWRRLASRLVVLFPFEVPFWERAGVSVVCHGHPLLENPPAVGADRRQELAALGLDPTRPVLVLAPGSRRSEWRHHNRLLFRAAARVQARRPDLQLAVPLAPRADARRLARDAAAAGVEVVCTPPPHAALFGHAELGLLCSGTVTLEAALAGLPHIAFYRGSWPNAVVAKLLLDTDRVALPNILLGGERAVFPELLQHRATPGRLAREALALLGDPGALGQLRAAAHRVRDQLTSGPTSAAVADEVLALATPSPR